MAWGNLLLFAVAVLGHTALIVAALNRIYSFPLPLRVLDGIRRTHDVLVIGFPIALFWVAGVAGPGPLRGGSYLALPLVLQTYLALCLLAALFVAVIAVRRALRRLPEAQLSNHSHTVDVAGRLGYRPVGSGPHRQLARLPGNEIFRVEVSEKVYRLPRLPAAWDGLSIVHISDLHFSGTIDRPFFEQVVELAQQLEGDMVALTGDLVEELRFVDWLPDTVGRFSAPLGTYFVLGNHDQEIGDFHPVREKMVELGWTDLGGRCVVRKVQGHRLVLAGTERPWIGEHPDLSGAEPDAFRLLLSHTPDHIAWARRQNVDLMLAGHNHGGQVCLPLFGPVYGPSKFGCRYASGPFWEDPTLLYVSRGVSGQHPLRWRCLPEVTKLVLRPQRRA